MSIVTDQYGEDQPKFSIFLLINFSNKAKEHMYQQKQNNTNIHLKVTINKKYTIYKSLFCLTVSSSFNSFKRKKKIQDFYSQTKIFVLNQTKTKAKTGIQGQDWDSRPRLGFKAKTGIQGQDWDSRPRLGFKAKT